MNAPDKPFVCTSEGCKMSFTNEDHLMVHKKKHDMNLNLGLGQKSNIFVADQTPTPTRFIRNCEELGLFQDLQNVNPFEETFRQATELVKSGHLPTPEISTDDTLHTPHVFPIINEDFHKKRSVSPPTKLNPEDDELKTPNILKPDVKEYTNEKEKVPDIKTPLILKENTLDELFRSKRNEEPTLNSNLFNFAKERMQIGDIKTVPICPDKPETQSREVIKQKVKEAIAKNQARYNKQPVLRTVIPSIEPKVVIPNVVNTVPINTMVSNPIILSPPFVNSGVQTITFLPVQTFIPKVQLPINTSGITEKLVEAPRKKSTSKIKKQTTNNISEKNKVDEKRQTLRIRNRAASFRSRNKRKVWVDNLVQENDNLTKWVDKLIKENDSLVQINMSLSEELVRLKNEVKQLKAAVPGQKIEESEDVSVEKLPGTSNNKKPASTFIPAFQLNVSQTPTLTVPFKRDNEIVPKVPIKRLKPNVKPLSMPKIAITKSATILPITINQRPKVIIEKPKKRVEKTPIKEKNS